MVTGAEPVCTADLLAILPAFQTSIIGSDELASKVEQVVLDTLGGMASWSGTLGMSWDGPSESPVSWSEWTPDIQKADGTGIAWSFTNISASSTSYYSGYYGRFSYQPPAGKYRIVYGGHEQMACAYWPGPSGQYTAIQAGSDVTLQLPAGSTITVDGPVSSSTAPRSVSTEISIYKL